MNFRNSYLLALPPAVAGSLAALWAWPGGLSLDMLVSINEGRYFKFAGHQEPTCGLLWAALQTFAPLPLAVPTIFLAQLMLYWGAFLLIAHDAIRHASTFTAIIALAAGFLPPLLCFTVMLDSNIQAGILWLAAIAVSAAVHTRLGMTTAGLLLWLGFLIRSGMICAVVPVAFTCISLSRPSWSKRHTLLAALAVGLTLQGVSSIITRTALGSPTRDSVLAVSQTFDMAAVYSATRVHHVPPFMAPDGHTVEEVLSHYTFDNVSGMFWRGDGKPTFRLPNGPEEGALIRAAWLQTIREFPIAWIKAKIRFIGAFLMIGVEWAQDFWPKYDGNRLVSLPQPEDHKTSPLGQYASATATTILWKGWFWIVAAGSLLLAGLLRRASRIAPAAAAYIGGLCCFVPHLLFGQAVLCRYYFLPYSLLVASILIVLPGVLARRRPADP